MEGEQIKSSIVDMLVENLKIVREHLDDVGDNLEFAEYKAKLDELICKLYKKKEKWNNGK